MRRSPGTASNRCRRVGEQIVFVGSHRFQAELLEVVDGGAQADGAGDVRRAGLELVRQRVVGRLLERDRADHVAAALVRRHRLQERGLAVQDADAGRPVKLVAGEDVEVAVQLLHVDAAGAARPGPHPPAPAHPAVRRAMICRTGLIVPSELDTWTTDTKRVRGVSSFSNSSSSSSPASLMGTTRRTAPFSSHRICQGTMLE